MKCFGIFGVVVAVFVVAPLEGQALSAGLPEDVGMSSQRLSRIDSLMATAIEQGSISGGVTAVARQGLIIHLAAHGSRDEGASGPMRLDAIFRLASMSKLVTVVAGLILYERGRFLMSDPVGRYLPEFQGMEVINVDSTGQAVTRPATTVLRVRHLFNHTSGMTYGVFGQEPLASLYDRAQIREGNETTVWESNEEFIQVLARQPLLFDPGTAWQYGLSNDVLGRLVEVISGRSLADFMEAEILRPLGMEDTGFYVRPEKRHRVVDFFSLSQAHDSMTTAPLLSLGFYRYTPAARAWEERTQFFAGGAGLTSTAQDYLRFLQMLLNGGELGGVRVLSPRTISLIPLNSVGEIPVSTSYGDTYGLGVAVRTRRGATGELESNGTYMWVGAGHHHFWVDPQQELIGLVLTQRLLDGPAPPRVHVRNSVYQAIIDPY